MVDFTLTDEQKDLRELAHNFAEKEVRPVAWDYDRDATWPQGIVEKAWEVGLMNAELPEAYGGPELGLLSGAPRSATITATTDGLLLALDADAFLDLVGRRPAVRGRLMNRYDQVPAAPPA